MKILVTGGAGYVGTSLIESLAARKETKKVVVLDNLSRPNYSFFLSTKFAGFEKVEFIKGELLDSRKLKSILSDCQAVYHLAARVTTPFANTDAHYFEQVNHWGTAELVYALEESQVETMIYTSSMGVYGSSTDLINEHSIPNPKTFYGISKLRGEEHVRRLFDHKRTYILRCGNVYGYNRSMRFDAVINRFVFETNFNHKISIQGTGKQTRSFIHIDLITKALVDLLFSSAPSGTYNLSDRNLEVLQIVETLKSLRPELEFMFINQHLNLRQLNVDPYSELRKYISIENHNTFEEELNVFLNHFSF